MAGFLKAVLGFVFWCTVAVIVLTWSLSLGIMFMAACGVLPCR